MLTATRVPLGLKATERAEPANVKVAVGLSSSLAPGAGGAAFQALATLSAPTEIRRVPSALIASPVTAPSWAGTLLSGFPSAAFQILTDLSSLPEMTRSPLGVNKACRTGPAWAACQTKDTG